ncbi:MAG: serine/threonine protein kinase [Planctomycetes bacterium]|nr:serine/threonine protein kinase [Planctomycetota bacterium]
MSDPYLQKRFGSVILVQKLGQGSMGVVYKGHHEAFDKDVAVKIMTPVHNEHSEQFYQRFMREGRAAAKVQHENVVQVIDAGKEEDAAYLVLEYVSGANLGEIVEKTGCIDQATAMRLGEQIAKGLSAIHSLKIIHRDIKPENILLGQGGIIKIADLGLAKELQDESVNRLTMSGMVVGTPYYISPEAISDITNAGPPADIYSFGATMYHLLLGRPPFDGGSAYEVMRAHLEQRFQPIREVNNTINPNLASLIEQCLEKDPKKRPQAKDIAKIIRRGGRVQGNSSSFAIIAVIIIAFFGSAGLITWKLLPHFNAQSDLIIGENAAALHIHASHSNVDIRIDQYPWKKLHNAAIALSPGEHHIRLRCYEDGVMMYWQKNMTMTMESIDISAQLRALAVNPSIINLSKHADDNTIVYMNGRCLGIEHALRIENAGLYNIALWKIDEWLSQEITIDVNGKITETPWKSAATLAHKAFLQSYLDHEAVTNHHMMTWLECEKIRKKHDIAAGRNWQQQSLQPLHAAQNLTPVLIIAIEAWASGNQLQICGDIQAHSFKQLYNQSLWYKDGKHSRSLGRPESASIILIAQK